MRYRTDAIVVRRAPYSESSQIVHLLTERDGLVHALARGTHRARTSWRGALDLATRGEADLAPRRDGLDILYGFRMTHPYRGIRGADWRFGLASYLLELSRLLTWPREQQQDQEAGAFPLLAQALDAIDGASLPITGETWALAFSARALRVAGVHPRVSGCVRCGGAPAAGARLSAAASGLLCASCASSDPLAVALGEGGAALLRRLLGEEVEGEEPRAAADADVRAARQALEACIEYRAERAFHSRHFVDRVCGGGRSNEESSVGGVA